MKEFVEKLIKTFKCEELRTELIAVSDVINIVNKLSEEYSVSAKNAHTGGWIACSERLPEQGRRYLVTAVWKDGDFKKHSVYDAVYGKDGLWHTYNYEPVSYAVIAWMPLPEPYIPKEEEQKGITI